MRDSFQSKGRVPVEREELKINVRGRDMEVAVDLSILAEKELGPEEVSNAMEERRRAILSVEQNRSGGQEKGRGEGGWLGRVVWTKNFFFILLKQN